MKRQAYVFDIDGTMAIKDKDREPFEWDLVDRDSPNDPVIKVAMSLTLAGHGIIFCSGRMEQARPGTERWLRQYFTYDYEGLFMRADGDYRKDSVVKREIFERDIAPHYEVTAIFDDRQQVVDMWRKELGLPCFQVAEGNF